MNSMLPNQEPVIIGEGNIIQGEALGSGHFGKVYKGSWQRTALNGKPVIIPNFIIHGDFCLNNFNFYF